MTKKYYSYEETHRTVSGRKQKLCTKCKKWKRRSVSEFCRDRYRKDGLKIRCKECDKADAHERRRKNRRKRKNVRKYLRYEQRHRTINGAEQKLCSRCNRWKDAYQFYRNRRSKDGLDSECERCRTKHSTKNSEFRRKPVRRNLRHEDRHRTIRGVEQKLCSRCNRWKDESHYHRHRRLKDGLSLSCKDCQKKAARKRLEQKKKGARRYLRYEDRHRIVKGAKEKLCSKCRKWKKESEYYKHRSSKDGLMGRCKKCSYKATSKSRRKR